MSINKTKFSSPNRSANFEEYRYIMLHHTGASDNGENSAKWLCNPASGASANYVVCKDGTVYELVPPLVTAWHAGIGSGLSVPDNAMNRYSIGIEIANKGDNIDKFPKAQLTALDGLIAYLDKKFGKKRIIEHKDWTSRKIDMRPNFPMANYEKYRKHIAPTAPKPAPKPSYPLLKVGAKGKMVRTLQQRLNAHGARLVKDGDFGPKTLAAVRSFQTRKKLLVDGIVGPKTWKALMSN